MAAKQGYGTVKRSGPNKNVVLILLDDGGAEWFAQDGINWSGLLEPEAGFADTPRLNEFRAQGVTFTRAYSAPICGPDRALIEIGRHAFRAGGPGLGGNIEDLDHYAFGLTGHGYTAGDEIDPAAVSTITGLARAIRMGRNGVADLSASMAPLAFTHSIAWFGKDHLHKNTGFEDYATKQGYGRYKGCQPNVPDVVDDGVNPPDSSGGHFHFIEVAQTFGTAPVVTTFGDGVSYADGEVNADFVAWLPVGGANTVKRGWDAYVNIRDAILWIDSRTQPFLLKLCMNPPHNFFEVPPYECPDDAGFGATMGTFDLLTAETIAELEALDGGGKGPGYRPAGAASKRRVYLANIEAIDALIGLLHDRIDPAKLELTTFLFKSDNGTVAEVIDAPYSPDHAKRTIFEQGVRVPLVVWSGGNFITSPGRTCDHLVHSTDVFASIMELLDCDAALWNQDGATIDGKSFVRVLRDPDADPARTFVYSELFLPLGSYVGGTGANLISPTTWKRSWVAGDWKLIKWHTGAPAPYSLFNISNALQDGSGLPGYLEDALDDLYSTLGSNATNAAKHAELLAAMNALLASA